MLVSIILPCYNHAQFLTDRVESILNQTYKNFELILLDDCSPDNSAEILLSYKNHPKVSHCIINEKNSGSTFAQWNKGVALAKGDLIWIAESDDVADLTFLETLVPQFELNKNLVLAYCQSYRMDSNGEITGDWKNHTDDLDPKKFEHSFTMQGLEFIINYFKEKNIIPNASGAIFKTAIFNSVNKSNPEFKFIGDWDLWYRLLSQGEIYYHNQNLNYFRYHETSVIAKAFKNNNRPIDISIEAISFFKGLLIFYKNNPYLNLRFKQSLHSCLKTTTILIIKQRKFKPRYFCFIIKEYVLFILKLRYI